MKRMKRIFSLMIVLAMVLSLVSLPAYAASEGTDYITVDDNTIRILTQDGWNAKWSAYKNKVIYLECDVTVDASLNYMKGKLIGRKNGVEGASVTINLNNVADGLFQEIQDSGATVDKVEVKNINITGTVNNANSTLTYKSVGALAARVRSYGAKNIEFENIVNDAVIINAGTTNSVGMVGNLALEGSASSFVFSLKNCVNNADFTSSYTTTDHTYQTGGIIGKYTNNKNGASLTLENCANYGDISANAEVGGIIGGSASNSTTGTYKLIKCQNYGNITAPKGMAGGLIGWGRSSNLEITGCANYGTILSKAQNAGGLIGAPYGKVSYDSSFNMGAVTANTGYAGGIDGGTSTYYATKNIVNCYNVGAINGGSGSVSGLTFNMSKSGSATEAQILSNVYNAGSIATTAASGVITTVGGVYSKSSAGTYYNAVIENVYCLDGTPGNWYVSKELSTGTEKVMINDEVLKKDIVAGFDRLPTGFDSSKWIASEGGYPVLKNNLPKNADGTDKVYKTVTLASYDSSMGNVLKDSETLVESGDTYKFTVNTEDGYRIKEIKADNVLLTSSTSEYETSAITDDTTITVVFEVIPQPGIAKSAANLFASTDEDGVYSIVAFARFIETDVVPEFGILLSFEEKTSENFVVGAEGISKYEAVNGHASGQYGVQFYGTAIEEGTAYWCRPYAKYGDMEPIYGDIITIE